MHRVVTISTCRFYRNKTLRFVHLMFLLTSVIRNFRLGRSFRSIRPTALRNVSASWQVKRTVHFGQLATMPKTSVPGGGGAKNLSMANNQTTNFIRVYIAVGSNLGNRFENIASSVKELCSDERVKLIQTSFLYETAPMYVTDQPAFLNGMIEIETTLLPFDLLKRVKEVEEDLGRDFKGKRNGPRSVDLDIIFYGVEDDSPSLLLESETLEIPHPRIGEREFVLGPLLDLKANQVRHPSLHLTVDEMYVNLKAAPGFKKEAVRILPLPRDRMLYFNETLIMGILNVTPDSFSDGGNYEGSAQIAAEQAFQMERDGATIIDIGGESTRPGAEEVKIEEELQRTIPVIQRIREQSNIPISIDTRHSVVARAAVEAGADIVNDVSGGTFDGNMLSTVAELGVPMILMHMRGTPATMQSMYEYDNVVVDVVASLMERSRAAKAAGIPRWMQILDPGIGFAKNLAGNLILLKKLNFIRSDIENMPILLGTSRKGFIGKITGEGNAVDRDFGSVASSITALCLGRNGCLGCNILRVHNVKGAKQAIMVMDAIVNA